MGLSGLALLGVACIVLWLSNYNYNIFRHFDIEAVIRIVVLVFWLLFCGLPPIVSIFIANRFKKPIPQMMMAAASLLFLLWFIYPDYELYMEMLEAHRNPNMTIHVGGGSEIMLIRIGTYFSLIFVPLWLIALIIESQKAKDNFSTP